MFGILTFTSPNVESVADVEGADVEGEDVEGADVEGADAEEAGVRVNEEVGVRVVEEGVVVVEEDAVEDDGLVPCLVFGCVSSG